MLKTNSCFHATMFLFGSATIWKPKLYDFSLREMMLNCSRITWGPLPSNHKKKIYTLGTDLNRLHSFLKGPKFKSTVLIFLPTGECFTFTERESRMIHS